MTTVHRKAMATYIRKSRQDRGSAEPRLEMQRTKLPQYAMEMGATSVVIYDDGHCSASKDNIPNLTERNRLIADIKAGAIDVVLVIEISRLSRDDSMKDIASFVDLCIKHNVRLAIPGREVNPANSSEWAILMMEGCLSAVEMKNTHLRLAQGARQAFLNGKFLGGQPPKPYVYDASMRKQVVDPIALREYQQLWTLAETHSAQEIAKKLGMPYSSVRRAISDKRLDYYQAIRRDNESGNLIPCEWDPVISADQANRIRAGRRTRTSNGQSTKPTSLLSGLDLLKCGYCGQTVKTWYNGTLRKNGTKLRYYGCSSKNTRNKCTKSRTVPQIVLDNRVLTNIFNTLDCLEDLMSHWLASQGRDDYDSQMRKLEIEEQTLHQQMDKLIEVVIKGLFSDADAAKQKAKLTAALAAIKAEKLSLKSTQTTPPDWDSLLLTREEFDHLDFTDRRLFLSLLLDEVRVYQTYAILNFKFPRDKNGDRTARIHLPEPRRGTAWNRQPLYSVE